jgi:hypothetical protein
MKVHLVHLDHNQYHQVQHVMMAFLMMHAFQIQFVLHVHNRSVDKNLDLANLVSRNTEHNENEYFRRIFTSSDTLNTPTTRALHFIGRFLIGQFRGVIVIST